MRVVLRAVVLVLTVSLSLVLLPIAINVGTGGTVPGFLEPYVGWVWPAIGVLWAVAVVTALLEVRNRRLPPLSRAADQPRNRPNALARIDRYYGERRAGSLAARVALALDEDASVVVRPYDLFVQPLDSDPQQVPDEAGIAGVFDDLQDSMLILGGPGAGKTTLLLDLARVLTEQARNDKASPLPVLVDLAGWSAQTSHRRDDDPQDSPLLSGFIRWLLSELADRYGIPPVVGRTWLSNGQFALLLDGLDEIAEPARGKFAAVLEELRRNYRIAQLAVTCRTNDYERLPQKLRLFGAVHIRPLTREQVLGYFAAVGPALDGARAAIEQDDALWELINTPLMLNVMALAYQGRAPQELMTRGVADLRRELFDTYLCEVLARNRQSARQYDVKTAVRRLWCLAWWTRSRAGDRTAVPRWVAPDGWYGLQLREVDALTYAVCLPALFAALGAGATLMMLAQYGALAGLAVAGAALTLVHLMPHPWQQLDRHGKDPGLLFALVTLTGTAMTVAVAAAALGLVELLTAKVALTVEAALIGGAYCVELLVSHNDRRRLLLGVRLAVVVVASAIVLSLGDALPYACGVAIGLLVAQGIRMVKSLPTDHLPTDHTSASDVGGTGRMDLCVVAGAAVVFPVALLLGADLTALHGDAVAGIVVGAAAAKAWRRRPPVLAGPMSRWLHDLLLHWTGYLPWRRRAFLQYAADRYVLTHTGRSGYAFIHLLVRDHLAECTPDELAAKVERRIEAPQAGSVIA